MKGMELCRHFNWNVVIYWIGTKAIPSEPSSPSSYGIITSTWTDTDERQQEVSPTLDWSGSCTTESPDYTQHLFSKQYGGGNDLKFLPQIVVLNDGVYRFQKICLI